MHLVLNSLYPVSSELDKDIVFIFKIETYITK